MSMRSRSRSTPMASVCVCNSFTTWAWKSNVVESCVSAPPEKASTYPEICARTPGNGTRLSFGLP